MNKYIVAWCPHKEGVGIRIVEAYNECAAIWLLLEKQYDPPGPRFNCVKTAISYYRNCGIHVGVKKLDID